MTPDELRKLAGAPATEIWIGTVRAALRHAADLADAAHDVRDENERLRADLDSYMEAANGYMREVEATRAERDALRKDAERYRYLRDDGSGFEITVREEDEDGHETWVSGYPPQELDIAIDAALAQTGANDAG